MYTETNAAENGCAFLQVSSDLMSFWRSSQWKKQNLMGKQMTD